VTIDTGGKMVSDNTTVSSQANRAYHFLFLSAQTRMERSLRNLFLVGLYLIGLAAWAFFLNFGDVPYDIEDWHTAGAYYYFLQDAVRSGQFPLHMDSPLVTTPRYLARPDTPLSPVVFLLLFLNPGVYTLVDTLIWYSIGFAGLLLLGRRYRFSLVAFTSLFLLFNFNGFITDHLAVGHFMYIGYFLLPFLALQLLKMIDQPRVKISWILATALVFTGMFMLGAFHLAIWCVLFMTILAVVYPRYLLNILKVFASAVVLSLWRILPPALEFKAGGNVVFLTGFPSLADLFYGMVKLVPPAYAPKTEWTSIGWWEIEFFIGLLGLAFLLVFGIYLPLRHRSQEGVLFAPILGVTLLSIGKIYLAIFSLPLPLFDSERVTTRFFSVPLAFLAILAAIHLQRFLESQKPFNLRQTLFSLGLLLVMAHDFMQHTRLWRVTNLHGLFPSVVVDVHSRAVSYPDPAYTNALLVGAIVSILGLATGLFLVWRQNKTALCVDQKAS